MKFIADSMLGRLARWLRLLGHDTAYYPRIEDSRLLRIAREEHRILLTRDTRLVKVRGLKDYLLLEENDPFEQLKHVLEAYHMRPDTGDSEESTRMLSRCSLCNRELIDVPREKAKGHVPGYVYRVTDAFRQCPGCGKFYWKGTHHGLLMKKLGEIL